MRAIYLLIAFALMVSCRAKKVEKEISSSVKVDSVFVDRKITVFQAVTDTVTIEKPCDSLGILRPFKQRYMTPQGNVTIEGKNNQITASIDLKSQADTTMIKSAVHKNETAKVKEVAIVRNVIPFWIMIALIVSVIINLYFIIRMFR